MANEPISKILNELSKVEQLLKHFQNSGKMPDIERDIVLSKLRNIYEFIQLTQSHDVDTPQAPVIQKEIVEEIQTILKEEEMIVVEQEPEKSEVTSKVEIEIISETKDLSIKETIVETVTTTPIKETIVETVTTTPIFETPPPRKQEHPHQILADKFQKENGFLNEALAKFQNLQDLSKKYQTKSISDISSAISLNDKFLYIKELFNNNAELYKQAIEILNNSGDFNSAVQYIDTHFQWDFNDFQVQKILELVHRRYLTANE